MAPDIIARAKNADKFAYMLLSRLESDCKYFLGYGNKCEKYLWSGNITDHINDMKELYNAFPDSEKPEWINLNDIEAYRKEMSK